MKKYAVRNLRLCTKDCICLYVCKTGATDTEDSIIDIEKCVGCGECASACPSGAISMVPYDYPPQQEKEPKVLAKSHKLAFNKSKEELISDELAKGDEDTKRFFKAFSRATRLVNEDLLRESGYMLAQSANTHNLLQGLLAFGRDDLPKKTIEKILNSVPCNEGSKLRKEKTVTYHCKICGYVFEIKENEEAVCPLCGAKGDDLEIME